MPPINPETGSLTVSHLIGLGQILQSVPGKDKIKPTLLMQQDLFGLFGTAVLLRQPNGKFFPIGITNLPNSVDGEESEEQEFDTGSDWEDEESEDDFADEEDFEEEENEGEKSKEEFDSLVNAIVDRLAPCFQHEKQPRFFENHKALNEFIPENVSARFDGYKLAIIPIRKENAKNVVGLIVCFAYEDSVYLLAEEIEDMQRIWYVFADSLKLLVDRGPV